MGWSRYVRLLIGSFVALNAGLYLFVLAMNPYGNLPGVVLGEHRIMDDNQRYQYPSILRSGRYDSLIVGTSTARMLDPADYEALLGGRFANVAIDAGTAFEQHRMIELFSRHAKLAGTLVVGLDQMWCRADAERSRYSTKTTFPEWLYDESRWNDLGYLFNVRAIEISWRRLRAAVRGKPSLFPPNGFRVFTPPEESWDEAKARAKIYAGGVSPVDLEPKEPPDPVSAAERAGWRFPALAWLEADVVKMHWKRALLVWLPVHLAALPRPGTVEAAREEDCKRRVAEIARWAHATVVDFRLRSRIASSDANFWDDVHYRLPIAREIRDGIAAALGGQAKAFDDTWNRIVPTAGDAQRGARRER